MGISSSRRVIASCAAHQDEAGDGKVETVPNKETGYWPKCYTGRLWYSTSPR